MFDVIVVGGGMVGLAQTLSLARCGFKVALIESGKLETSLLTQAAPMEAKVVAISRASEAFLTKLEVWAEIKAARYCPYQTMKVWDSSGTGAITFSAAEFFAPNLGHIVENKLIAAILLSKIKQLPVTIFEQVTVQTLQQTTDYAQILLSTGDHLQAKLVIAADGVLSTLRKLCDISSHYEDYQQSALVTVVQSEFGHNHTAYQRFAADGPLALLPLPLTNQVAVVWTSTTERAKWLQTLTRSDFARELTTQAENVLGQMHEVGGERWVFPLRSHHAKQYFKGRCVLVGDAAHSVHPLAGQGVNLGFADVAVLSAQMNHAKQHHRDWGSQKILARYQRNRQPLNQYMIWAMGLFKKGFSNDSPRLQILRNFGLNWVDQHKAVKHLFARMAWGTQNSEYLNMLD